MIDPSATIYMLFGIHERRAVPFVRVGRVSVLERSKGEAEKGVCIP